MNIKVKGGQVLSGEISPSGSKNSSVAIIPSTMLFDKKVTLRNIPEISDVAKMVNLMEKLGSKIVWDKTNGLLEIDNANLTFKNINKDDLGNLRGMSIFWGPMLARFGKVDFSDLPGGCTLGSRPLDTHYMAFSDLGVRVSGDEGCARMDASRAKATEIWLNEMSPTATESVVIFATKLSGTTRIIGAASELQVQDLCEFLNKCGARISGAGSSVLTIKGGIDLSPKEYKLYSDHYEITTFMALAASTRGSVKIHNALPRKIQNIINTFSKFGVDVKYKDNMAMIEKGQEPDIEKFAKGRVLNVKAQPWPGLPVDTLPLFIPLALAAKGGQALFHNWMYEAGLFWTSELSKLGANIIMGDPHRVIVTAGNKLKGTELEAPYIIRATVAMVMAAMIAKGESTILNADALYRGHPHFAKNLRKLGAVIEEVT
jgi:UDP-N-acetylglucosamine 1-carboxyvinyltransferase